MKKNIYICLFILINYSYSSLAQTIKVPVYPPEQIIKKRFNGKEYRKYDNARNYIDYYLRLSEDYIAYDTKDNVITKSEFLKTLASGFYIPVWLKSNDSKLYYKLYKMNPGTDAEFIKDFQQVGQTYYEQYKREGEKFPNFSYKDLNGNVYTSKNTKGKILVLDCWFVACSSCVAGMPQLNKILLHYKNRKDILFIGLDNDLKFNAVHFLKTTRFDFATVPLPDDYFSNTLKVSSFPTSFIINKDGVISKVVNSPKELEVALKNEAAK